MNNHRQNVALNVETLEDRLVPASVNLSTSGILTVTGQDVNETMQIRQTATKINLIGGPSFATSQVEQIVIDARGGHDRIDLAGVQVPAKIYGGWGNDTIIGTQKADLLDGGEGNDLIFGMAGNDTIKGGGGNDKLFGKDGYDYLYGGAGSDYMYDGNPNANEFYGYDNDGVADFVADAYAPASGFSAAHVKQGSSALTCYFLGTIAGMAKAGVNMNAYIRFLGHNDAGVGSYQVSFWNGQQWAKVNVQFGGATWATDAQPTADYASWTIIMHRAWQQYYGNRGGFPSTVMFALGKSPVNALGNFNLIANTVAQRGTVVVGTVARPLSMLEGNHAYTVVQAGYLNGVAMIQLRNPWAYDGGSSNDGNSRDGLIWLTWAQFSRSMDTVTACGY